VLIENFKVGGLTKFGLDYKSLAPDCPRLVYCSISGFGQTGPYASRAGYDLLAQGMGGVMDITGMVGGEPTRIGFPVSDIVTGVYSVVGILAALSEREHTGKGGYVDTALMDSTVGVLSSQALNYLVSGKVPNRIGNALANIVPYQVFEVVDGYVIVATGNDNQFTKLCHALGASDIASNPAYKDNAARLANREELISALTARTSKMTRQNLLEKLEAVQVPAGPINNLEQVFNDPQVKYRGMQIALKSDAARTGIIPGVRTPIVLNGQSMASDKPSPLLGQHTHEILREIGEV
jgi:crotonobetainyl-CoA:carnitine CoA-transferase CaiB-like acyl-CoA transferase